MIYWCHVDFHILLCLKKRKSTEFLHLVFRCDCDWECHYNGKTCFILLICLFFFPLFLSCSLLSQMSYKNSEMYIGQHLFKLIVINTFLHLNLFYSSRYLYIFDNLPLRAKVIDYLTFDFKSEGHFII